MLSSPHGSSISFLKMLWAETAGRAREQQQSAERGEDFFDRRVVDFEQKLAFGRAAKLFLRPMPRPRQSNTHRVRRHTAAQRNPSPCPRASQQALLPAPSPYRRMTGAPTGLVP